MRPACCGKASKCGYAEVSCQHLAVITCVDSLRPVLRARPIVWTSMASPAHRHTTSQLDWLPQARLLIQLVGVDSLPSRLIVQRSLHLQRCLLLPRPSRKVAWGLSWVEPCICWRLRTVERPAYGGFTQEGRRKQSRHRRAVRSRKSRFLSLCWLVMTSQQWPRFTS